MDDRCPRKLKQYPCFPCQLGYNGVFAAKSSKPNNQCPWGVKSVEANHCMWIWLKLNPGENTATKIAEELDITTQRVGQIKAQALKYINEHFPLFFRKYINTVKS